jgi:hypothetical protein
MSTHPELLRDVTEVSSKIEDDESLDERECILVCSGSKDSFKNVVDTHID